MYGIAKLKKAVSFASLLLFVVLLQGQQTTGGFGYTNSFSFCLSALNVP